MAANDLERLAPLLATYLVHSTLWLGGCGALVWLTRLRHPAIRHTAWKWSVVAGFVTALAQFTLPVTAPSLDLTLVAFRHRATPIGQAREPAATTLPLSENVAVDDSDVGELASPSGLAATDALGAPPQARELLTESPPSPAPRDTRTPPTVFDWLRTAVIIWAVAVGVLLTRTFMAWRRLSRLGDLTELSAGKERELLDRLLAATNIRRQVRLFRSQSGTNPMAWGFWRWQIAVPGPLFERLERRELRALIAHELAHLVRGDTRWLCAWSLLGAVGFLQPLNRVAHRQIRRAAELLSDGWAVRATGDPLSLARALTKTAELRARPAVSLATPAVASPSALAERVDRLIGPHRAAGDSQSGRWLAVIVAWTAMTAAVVWLPGVKLMTAGELAEGGSQQSAEAATRSTDDPIRALDRELDSLDRELDELRPVVAGAHASNARTEVAKAWRGIERRRGKVREGHVRVRQLLEQVTAGEGSAAGNR